MGIIRTIDRSSSYQANSYKLRESGVLKAWPAAPAYVATGGGTSGVSSLTLGYATDANVNDFIILIVETNGNDTTVAISGWTHFPGSPVVDVADATGSKLNVLWRLRPTAGTTTVTVPDCGDHQIARTCVFSGVASNRTFVTATDTKTTASTSVSWPALTTPSPNNVVFYVASRPDSSASTTAFSSFANANLTSVTELGEMGSTSGSGGGFVFGYGVKAAVGSTGNATATCTASVTNALFAVALEPAFALPA